MPAMTGVAMLLATVLLSAVAFSAAVDTDGKFYFTFY